MTADELDKLSSGLATFLFQVDVLLHGDDRKSLRRTGLGDFQITLLHRLTKQTRTVAFDLQRGDIPVEAAKADILTMIRDGLEEAWKDAGL